MINNLTTESGKRLEIVNKILNIVKASKLTGLLVTGSLAWGKNYAANSKSDIDFYLLGNSLNDYLKVLPKLTFLPADSNKIITNLIKYDAAEVDTRSIKTTFDGFNGTAYFFLEKDIVRLSKSLVSKDTVLFGNLRSHSQPQTKNYKSFNRIINEFTTPIFKLIGAEYLWLRKDPLMLHENGQFFGSIFLAHLLTGEIYLDKSRILNACKEMARKSLKNRLGTDREFAFKQFVNYLPRIERMKKETIENIFISVWNS